MTSQRLRALFFCNFPPPDTGQTIGSALTRDLLAADLAIRHLDTSGGDLNLQRNSLGRLRRALSMWRRIRQLARTLAREPVDVLYFVAAGGAGGHLRDVLAVRCARPHVVRIVAHVRSGEFGDNFRRPGHERLTRRFVADVDAFIFLSESLSRSVAEHVPATKRWVVPNVIDPPLRLTDAEVTAKLERRARRSSFRVLYLGNMIPAKGFMDLAAALPLLRSRSPLPVETDFVGAWLSAADRRAFERLLAETGLTEGVRAPGSLSDRSAVRRLLADADAIVLPTYYPVEAQPRSLIEGMNAATPVVATRHASIPEFVRADVNGFLVDAHAPEQIAQALLALTDPVAWRRLAEGARRTYLERFDPEPVQRALLAAFLGTPLPSSSAVGDG